MPVNYGIRAKEVATSIATPNVADCGLPFVVGTAPLHTAEKPAKVGIPVLCTSWSEAVEKLGFSYDWESYTLSEFMYSHFQLFQSQPVIFCNVLDPVKNTTDLEKKSYDVTNNAVALPFGATDLTITRPAEAYPDLCLIPDKDMANAVLTAKGSKTVDGGAYTFIVKLAEEKDVSTFHLLVNVTANGKTYSMKTSDTGKFTNVHFTLNSAGKQVDFVDGKKGSGGIDLSNFTGDIKVEVFTCSEKITAETYPDAEKLTLIEEATFHLEKGRGPDYLTEGEDYVLDYDADDNICNVQLLDGSLAYDSKALEIVGKTINPEAIKDTDIVAGINAIDLCMTVTGKVPDLICAPKYSQSTNVSAVMAAKAENILGLFTGKAVIDLDMSEVTDYSQAIQYKNSKNLVDPNLILCWPMVKQGDYTFHLSTQLCGLMAKTDTANDGVPYESPSNLNLQMDSCVLPDGTEVNLTFEQANVLKDNAITTALNFMQMGWVAWGNYTACYPANTDVKDYFIPISRMFDFVKTTLIRTFWSKTDKPMTRRLIDTIVDSTNIWLNGLTASEKLYGARVEVLDDENPLTDLMNGIIRVHVYIAPPPPMQECDFVLEYDPSYVEAALLG